MHIVKHEKDGVYLQHYERQNEQYVPTTGDLVAQPPIVASHDNKYVALRGHIGSNAIRRKLHETLNSQLNTVLDILWPVNSVVSLHQPETGETIRSMTLHEARNPGSLFPANDLEGVIIPYGQSLAYWSFISMPSWPKWLGLLIGLLLAILVARDNLRRKSTHSTVTHSP